MTEAAPSVLEAVLRRDRAVVVAALVMVIGLSWLWIALGAGMEMSAVEMTRMPRDMVMTPAVDACLYGADVRHVVGDDGGDDVAKRGVHPSDLRAYQPPRASS
jgi:predicted metal-binding membrane protein